MDEHDELASGSTHQQNVIDTPERLFAQQACNECKRRKGRCDRVAPECGTCAKYNRHCLYAQHIKSPLTRKHLTHVEHRLEAATAEIRILRRKINELQRVQEDLSFKSSGFEEVPDMEGTSRILEEASVRTSYSELDLTPSYQMELSEHVLRTGSSHADGNESPLLRLEDTPLATTEFDWNEQDVLTNSDDFSQDEIDPDTSGFIDGMASLSVNENEAGYLGVASGAALLRMLHQHPELPTHGHPHRFCSRQDHDSVVFAQPNPNMHVIDAMIDGYFRTYHLSYPIVHEARFRAQYSEVIPKPEGTGWRALMYMIATLGAFSSSLESGSTDITLFQHAKSQLSIGDLESGNTSLVQALTLMSNYLQKRNQPNSGYNYLGLALRMAMGLGLHKEFSKWNISPLEMEIRRRIWWTLFVFDIGATITFSRPLGWPHEGIEAALPLNIHDRLLTAATTTPPMPIDEITTYSAVRAQVTFHRATNCIYSRVISVPFPSPQEALEMDQKHISPWLLSLPSWYTESAIVPYQYALSHAVMMWRYRNLRLIMYRPFVIRQILKKRVDSMFVRSEGAEQEACRRCLSEASASIQTIDKFWSINVRNKLAAWYCLYFMFQATLLPIFCLRNDPTSEDSSAWRENIKLALTVMESMFTINSSSMKCYEMIQNLCGKYLDIDTSLGVLQPESTQESPQTQISNVYSMMWPNVPEAEANVMMQDENWLEFFGQVSHDEESASIDIFTEPWNLMAHP